MAKPTTHAAHSVAKWGGEIDDYLPIHDFLDSSKSAHASMKHRVIFHNSLGPFIAEQLFGHVITNSDGKTVSVRDIAEQHIIDDLGFIPSLDKWLEKMPEEAWMYGIKRTPIKIVD